MLSRAAESIYWLHRYIERAENVARFIDVNLHLMLDLTPDSPEQWQPLVNTTGDRHDFARRHGKASKENVFTFPHPRHRQPQLDSLLPAGSARQRPLGARDHLLGHVGARQQVLPHGAAGGAAGAARAARVLHRV